MKRRILMRWDRSHDHQHSVEDLKDSLHEIFDPNWKTLQTPIILDVDIVDILMVNAEGQLCIVKVLQGKTNISYIGTLLKEYASINSKRNKLCAAYPHDHIDVHCALHIKLFITQADDGFIEALSAIKIPIEIYKYFFVQAQDDDGLVVEKITVDNQQHKNHEYDSMLRIMGENVRSDKSNAPQKTYKVPFKPSPDAHMSPIDESLPQSNVDVMENDSIINCEKLSEEELIAFFDLEKKVDSYCNIKTKNYENK